MLANRYRILIAEAESRVFQLDLEPTSGRVCPHSRLNFNSINSINSLFTVFEQCGTWNSKKNIGPQTKGLISLIFCRSVQCCFPTRKQVYFPDILCGHFKTHHICNGHLPVLLSQLQPAALHTFHKHARAHHIRHPGCSMSICAKIGLPTVEIHRNTIVCIK